jgi:hypothetical protein
MKNRGSVWKGDTATITTCSQSDRNAAAALVEFDCKGGQGIKVSQPSAEFPGDNDLGAH